MTTPFTFSEAQLMQALHENSKHLTAGYLDQLGVVIGSTLNGQMLILHIDLSPVFQRYGGYSPNFTQQAWDADATQLADSVARWLDLTLQYEQSAFGCPLTLSEEFVKDRIVYSITAELPAPDSDNPNGSIWRWFRPVD